MKNGSNYHNNWLVVSYPDPLVTSCITYGNRIISLFLFTIMGKLMRLCRMRDSECICLLISVYSSYKKNNNNKNPYFINGCLNNSSPTKTFTTNGFQKIVTPNGSMIKSISHLYKHLGFSYPSIQIKIHQVSTFHHTYSNSSTIQKQNLIVHLSLNFGHFKIEFIFKYWRQRRSKYVIGVRVLIYNVIG